MIAYVHHVYPGNYSCQDAVVRNRLYLITIRLKPGMGEASVQGACEVFANAINAYFNMASNVYAEFHRAAGKAFGEARPTIAMRSIH